MDQQHLNAPMCAQVSPTRRLVAAGLIRRTPGRTLTVRATAAGVTGSITKAAPDRTARLAELHRLCRADYDSAATTRAAAIGAARDQLALARAHAAEAVNAR
ncbi:hypothetical protein [Streptomyces sp. NPDC005890]|uniref:hypothetical protein n=1 Tax=Streptomyces sp. NPDC005890 TaxID=3154568 RepID=UPI0033F9008A